MSDELEPSKLPVTDPKPPTGPTPDDGGGDPPPTGGHGAPNPVDPGGPGDF